MAVGTVRELSTSEDAADFLKAFTAVMDAIHDSARPVWHFGWGLTTRAARRVLP